jgi:hypothetical protein
MDTTHFSKNRKDHCMRKFVLQGLVLAASVTAATAMAQTRSAKDIVIEQVAAPMAAAQGPTAATAIATATNDAVVVSVLLESPDGTLTPKSTETVFLTGDRFRVKLLASRAGKVAIYNTTPRGELKQQPIWRGEVKVGQETITPRLAITGDSGKGTDLLHVVLEPANEPNLFAWLTQWIGASRNGNRKDIRLDVQSTPTATYLLTDAGRGIEATVRIQHR